eukprot:1869977-Pyramimonas_sp.AAC.1
MRRFYDAHKIARLLAGTCRGPRGRSYNIVPSTRASAAEWITRLQQPGVEGGAQAQLLTRGEAPQEASGFWRMPFECEDGVNRAEHHSPSHLEWINQREEEYQDFSRIHEEALVAVEKLRKAIK